MAAASIIERLGAWEGYAVAQECEQTRGGERWCILTLEALPQVVRCCSGCGWRGTAVHDQEQRRIRDLPIFDVPVELVVPRLRLACPNCGPKLEALSWLEPYDRVTRRLATSVARLCKVMPLHHVAKLYGLAWSTVKRIDHRHLKRELGPIDLRGVEVIAMDEFAIRKRGAKALLTSAPRWARPQAQMSMTCRSSAKPTRHVVPSPGSMLAVRWLIRTITPTTVLRCLSSKATLSPQRKSSRRGNGTAGCAASGCAGATPAAGGSIAA